MAYRILISYSWKNAGERRALTAEIGAIEGVEVISDKIITPGRKIHDTVSKMIDNCDCVIALLTPESISSGEVLDELARAHERRKFIIPVLRDSVTPDKIPWYLRDVRQIRYSEERFDDMLDTLLLQVEELVKPPSPRITKRKFAPPKESTVSTPTKALEMVRVWVKSGESIHLYNPALWWSARAITMIGPAGSSVLKRAKIDLKSSGAIYKLSFAEIKELRVLNVDKGQGVTLRIDTHTGRMRQGQLLPPGKDELSGGQVSFTISDKSIPQFGGKDEDDTEVAVNFENISRIEFITE